MALYDLNRTNLSEVRQNIIQDIYKGEETTLSFSYPQKKLLVFFNGILSSVMGHIDLMFLLESFFTILRESLLNAVKANAKRLYFQAHKVDINNEEAYNDIMQKFRNDLIGDLSQIEQELMKSTYYVNFVIKLTKDEIQFKIENNSKILPKEADRINMRITQAWKFQDFSEAYDSMYDETEGAGLGIILTVLLLKNIEVTPEHYKIYSEGEKTVAAIRIPRVTKKHEVITKVKKKIISEINLLPTFPQNIIDLQRMCDNPDSSINLIADKIKQDPSLTADILKLSNSAGFITSRRIDNINEALMRIGLTNLKYILIASSTKKIMDQRYKQFEKIWAHCLKVAFFAQYLTKKLKLKKINDQVFITSLLHDLGKIVLLSVDLELTNWIADFVQHRGIRSTTILEEVSIGISHSTIGKLIAEKWNFAPFLLEAIAFHHAPLQATKNNKTIVNVTYLANVFVGMITKKYTLENIEPAVLQNLGIKSYQECKSLYEECKEAFDTQDTEKE